MDFLARETKVAGRLRASRILFGANPLRRSADYDELRAIKVQKSPTNTSHVKQDPLLVSPLLLLTFRIRLLSQILRNLSGRPAAV
jgi:hypothetical protein